MFAFQHSACFATAIDTILYGEFTGPGSKDVICIKESSIELLQIVTDPRRELLKSRFQHSIFGSFSASRALKCSFSDSETRTSTNVDMDSNNDYEYPDFDIPFTSQSRSTHDHILGSDILVSLLENGNLVFWTVTTSNGNLEETGRLEPLIKIVLSEFARPDATNKGNMLAIDPMSRVIAVGTLQNRITLLILKEVMSRTNFDPVVAGAVIENGDFVWHMEFLHTSTSSRDRILLAAVVYSENDNVFRVVIHAIDASDPFDTKVERIGRLPLEKGSPLPVLLVPLKEQPEAFLLITEQHISYLTTEDIISGNTFYTTSLIPRRFGELECPLFTSYAIPTEISTLPYVYLGSSKGALFRVEIHADNFVTETVQVGTVHPMSKTMCYLGSMEIIEDDKFQLTDVLFYAGEGADNQIIAVKRDIQDRDNVFVLQNLVNRAPVKSLDTCSTEDGVFMCSGLEEQGTINITADCIQAEKIASCSGWHGVNRLWSFTVLNSKEQATPCLLASSALDTRMLVHEDGVLKDDKNTIPFMEDVPTILVADMIVEDRQVFLQICTEYIRVCDNFFYSSTWSLRSFPRFKEYSITLATLCNGTQAPCILVYLSSGRSNLLLLLEIALVHSSRSFHIEIRSETAVNGKEASLMKYITLENRPILMLGTYEPSILLYDIQSDGIELVTRRQLELSSEQIDIPHSAVFVYPNSNQSDICLLIGTRNGHVLYINVRDLVSSESRDNVEVIRRKLGEGSVQILCENPYSALALCERVWRICVDGENKGLCTMPVLLPRFQSIHAITMVELESSLLCIAADGSLHLFELASECHINTVKIAVGESPLKLIPEKSTDKALVVTRTVKNDRAKYMDYQLRLIDLSRTKDKPSNTVLLPSKEFGMNSHILCIAEWNIRKGEKIYRYICLGLGQADPQDRHRGVNWTLKGGTTHGALVLYRVKHSNDGEYLLKPVLRQHYDTGGVFAICSHPEGLLFSTGAILCLYQLDQKQGKLVEVAKKMTRFAIKSITVYGSRICVASFTDSITFYDYDPEHKTIEFVKSDATSRTVNHSLMVDEHLAVGTLGLGDCIFLHDVSDSSSFEKRLIQKCLVHSVEIVICPVLGSLRSKSLLTDTKESAQSHLLPWSETESYRKPILVATVPGSIVAVNRISPRLFEFLLHLQDVLLYHDPFMFYDFDLLRDKLSITHVIYGDLIALYIRLPLEQQQKIFQDIQMEDEQSLRSLAQSILGVSDESLRERTTVDLLCEIIQILLDQY